MQTNCADIGKNIAEQTYHTLQAYIVIRTKRGESQQQRLGTLLQSPVFRLHHGKDSFAQQKCKNAHARAQLSLVQTGPLS